MISAAAMGRVTVNGKESIWVLPNDTSFADAKEMLFQHQKALAISEDNAKAMQEALKAEEDAKKAAEAPKPDIVHDTGVSLDGNQQ